MTGISYHHWKKRPWLPWPLLPLLIVSSAPELILQLSDHGIIGPVYLRPIAYALGAFNSGLVTNHGPVFPGQSLLMFVTYAFLHTGLSHLIINMIGLVWLARQVLTFRTPETFLTLYLLSAVGAAEIFALTGPAHGVMVGASGALFGLLGVFMVDSGLLASRGAASSRMVSQIVRVLLTTIVLILFDLGSRSILGTPIAWQAHAGGFLTGALIALFIPPRSNLRI